HLLDQFGVPPRQIGQPGIEKEYVPLSERVGVRLDELSALGCPTRKIEYARQLPVFGNQMLPAQFLHRHAVDTCHGFLAPALVGSCARRRGRAACMTPL